ncbi:hypothetical protein BJF79_11690 [Actinomadura sp. CNU-125]|uniref:DUF5959 family protein n=1 Tax=Actinomadura sp. CNU-125 TaxID=1904961 RepID=UPI00095D8514|nr:DUF5959 family protein [Actinomadura sp. CNU-125]OLT27526.1 hypothetical protein BJF79_11690 [Actinomadura sp. CNU-125]
MTDRDFPDLIHLADENGSSLVHRFTDRHPSGLEGEIEVRSTFVNGRTRSFVFPEDLDEWEAVLDDLDRGDNTAWREDKRAKEIWLELDDNDRVCATVVDHLSSLVAVELTIKVPDGWLDDHYDRLQRVRDAIGT